MRGMNIPIDQSPHWETIDKCITGWWPPPLPQHPFLILRGYSYTSFSSTHRYVTVFETGLEARRSKDPIDFERLHHQQSDVCMLRLFEAFLESAPQIVLQLYIMVATNDENLFTGEKKKPIGLTG